MRNANMAVIGRRPITYLPEASVYRPPCMHQQNFPRRMRRMLMKLYKTQDKDDAHGARYTLAGRRIFGFLDHGDKKTVQWLQRSSMLKCEPLATA
jgi:hypothetical protein